MVEIGDFGEHESIARIDYNTLHEEKVAKARQEMDERGLEALLCVSDPNIEYVTNVPVFSGISSGIGGTKYAVLPRKGTPIVFDEACHAFNLDIGMPDYVEVEKAVPLPLSGIYNSHGPAARDRLVEIFVDQISGVLEEVGVAKDPVGIDVGNELIINSLNDGGIDASAAGGEALAAARETKTHEERQLFRRLSAIIDGCHAKLAETARPGMTEREVWSECVSYAIDKGLSTDGGYICSGPQTWPKDSTRETSNRVLRAGDIILADFFNFGLYGYRSCCYRTFSVGPVSQELKDANQQAVEWMDDAKAALEPGASTQDVVKTWPKEEEQWHDRPPYIKDSEDAWTTFFMNMGHGLGLSLYEPPYFWVPTATQWPQELKEGMVVAIETLEGEHDGSQGVRIEDMILITENGSETLTKWPVREIVEIPLN